MYCRILVFLMLLVLPIPANCASILFNQASQAEVEGICKAGEKFTVTFQTAEPLPASSFYRVEIDCPIKPSGAEITTEAGYPASDMVFSIPGHYECAAELGIVTKSSCAGVKYRPLALRKFSLDVQQP